jgi:hypothetical protein
MQSRNTIAHIIAVIERLERRAWPQWRVQLAYEVMMAATARSCRLLGLTRRGSAPR